MIMAGIRPRLTQTWYRLLGYGLNGRCMDVFPDDVYLVGYPKSGNTWLDFLVACLLAPRCEDVNFFCVEEFVADIYFNNAKQLKSMDRPRYFKSHESYDVRYEKVVYIVRDPRDVAVSYYYHHIKLRMIHEDASLSDFVSRFVSGEIGRQCGWGEHVREWLDHFQSETDFLLVRYEDLKKNNHNELSRIAQFLNIAVSDQRLENAVRWCLPENMRRIEQKEQGEHPALKHTRVDVPFVRKAISGGWRSELQITDVRKISDRWGDVMAMLNYE